jgi:hypothetical protein
MMKASFKKVWAIPLLLSVITLFGLLAALLGTGYWYGLSWIAMIVPLLVIIWKIWGHWPMDKAGMK